MVNGDNQAKERVEDTLNELDNLEGFFGGKGEDDYDDDYEDDYDDDYEDDYDDDYEGMDNDKENDELEEAIAAEMKLIDKSDQIDGFGNMFNLDLSKNCMILIVIVLILILCKEDIMNMSFFKKLLK
jgi:hypothetical protein